MTEPVPLSRNRPFLIAVSLLLALVVFFLVRGLFPAHHGTATPPPEQPAVNIETHPGTGTASRFSACAVLTPEVVSAAGLAYGDQLVRTGPDSGPQPGDNSCGGAVKAPVDGLPPQVHLYIADSPVHGPSTSHGLTYLRRAGSLPDTVGVQFTAGALQVLEFSKLPGGEATLTKLIDGVAANLAAGPKPAPEYRYPAPYNLAVKPCDVLSVDLAKALTSQPTDGKQTEILPFSEGFLFPGLNVEMGCWRDTKSAETVRLTRRIYRSGESAAYGAKFLCRMEKDAKASPIDYVACTSHADDREYRIVFSAGQEALTLEYRADHPPAIDLTEAARKIHDLIGR